jgi:hypothetical protein
MEIELRKYPYPYIAALSISSDIDETKSFSEFIKIQKFLNTNEKQNGEVGIGLEIANSFFMYDRENFAYFNSDDDGKNILKCIESGYLDTLHTFGDDCSTRQEAERCLYELIRNDVGELIWVNHRLAPTNLGARYKTNMGDVIYSKCYHADITIKAGFDFFWLGNITRIIGQNSKLTLKKIVEVFNIEVPLKSGMEMIKECIKVMLGVLNVSRFKCFSNNDLINIEKLRDGQRVYEFKRFCNYPFKDGLYGSAHSLAYLLSDNNLRKLKSCGGICIIYTHFGKNYESSSILPIETIKALRKLRIVYDKGEILVTSTLRLLKYYRTWKYLKYKFEYIDRNSIAIIIDRIEEGIGGARIPNLEELQGITFIIPETKCAKIYLREKEMISIRNPRDINGKISISIPWKIRD